MELLQTRQDEDSSEQNYLGLRFNGTGFFCHGDYSQSSGIITTEDDDYRIRFQERDEHIYVDIWEGEYLEDSGSFEPEGYLDSGTAEEIPETAESFLESSENCFEQYLN